MVEAPTPGTQIFNGAAEPNHFVLRFFGTFHNKKDICIMTYTHIYIYMCVFPLNDQISHGIPGRFPVATLLGFRA